MAGAAAQTSGSRGAVGRARSRGKASDAGAEGATGIVGGRWGGTQTVQHARSPRVMPDRIETLRQMLEADPGNCFLRYGLAQEHIKAGTHQDAISEFEKIFEADPDYQAAYFHAGKTLEKLGRAEEARATYQRGIETSMRTGDAHARSELEGALSELD